MGSRRNLLEKLGIPEYPWSSDDEEQAADLRQTTARTSGPQPPAASVPAGIQQSPTSNLLFLSGLWAQPRSRVAEATVAAAPSAAGPSSSRVGPSFMSRTIDTPPPEISSRANVPGPSNVCPSNSPTDDIRRVLAFRRLTSNMNLLPSALSRYRNQMYNTAQRRRLSRPGIVVPSEANSRWTPYNNRSNYISLSLEDQPPPPPPPPPPPALLSRLRRTQSMEVLNSEDEERDVAAPQAINYPLSMLSGCPGEDHPAPEPVAELETEETQGGTSNDTSGSGVAIEDVVVEISPEPANAAADLTPVSDQPDQPMPSTSRADEVDAPGPEQVLAPLQNNTRRTPSSSTGRPGDSPVTVQDFNRKLLRLLECPVCLEWMEPPMSQCRRGHLVCSRCRSRLASCPVCRTTFSSVRNRAMEGVSEMLRYPCRHGCGREVRLRKRGPHEHSCDARKYACPVPLCLDTMHLAREALHSHIHTKHAFLVKNGPRHRFGIKVNSEAHDNWLIIALDEVFHVKVDVDIRTWGVVVYVAYIGPKCNAKDYAYEVSIDGQYNGRKMIYRRSTHSDLESSSHNVSRQDCFHLSLDQALNFIRYKNRQCDAERILEFEVALSKIDPPPSLDDSDS